MTTSLLDTPVMTDAQRAVVVAFRDQVLATVTRDIRGRSVFYAEDFLDLSSLVHILDTVFDDGCDLSAAGQDFIRQYYGLEPLAELLMSTGAYGQSAADRDDLVDYLRKLL